MSAGSPALLHQAKRPPPTLRSKGFDGHKIIFGVATKVINNELDQTKPGIMRGLTPEPWRIPCACRRPKQLVVGWKNFLRQEHHHQQAME